MDSRALRGVLVAFLMKLCNKVVEVSFSSMDPAFFRRINVTETGSSICIFDDTNTLQFPSESFTGWIYTARYLLPVLGGLMSSAWLGYTRVLQVGGAVMLLATVLKSVLVYLGFMCESSAFIAITWLLLPLFLGLTQPSIMYALFLWNHLPRLSTITPAVYYFAVAFGAWIDSTLSPMSESKKLGCHSTLISVALSVLFIALSLLLPKDSNHEPFELPTRSRMKRYFMIFSGLVLAMFSVGDIRRAIYTAEITHFMNGTTYFAEFTWLSPLWINNITMMTICTILLPIGIVYPKKLPVHPRLQLGILLELAVAVCLLIFTTAGSVSTTAVAVVYAVASVLDGFVELLVIIAFYDLAQQMSPRNSQALVFGILFTVWGLSNLAIRAFLLALGQMPMYAYHVVTLTALSIAAVYNRCLALPLAEQLTIIYDYEDDLADRPLLN